MKNALIWTGSVIGVGAVLALLFGWLDKPDTPRVISVNGECLTSAPKDRTAITLRVTTLDKSAATSMKMATAKINEITDYLKTQDVQMQTTEFNSYERSEWNRELEKSVVLGTETTIAIEVSADNIETIEKILTQFAGQEDVYSENLRMYTSAETMNGFISAQFGAVQNKINLAMENLSMNTVNNYIAEINGTARERKLLTEFNTATGGQLTAETAMQSDEFLRFAVKEIKLASDRMTRMTKGIFNDGDYENHTPYDLQRLYISSEYERSLETVTQYQAFKDRYVQLDGYETVPFWQSIKSPNNIDIKRASDDTEKKVNNIIGVLFDYEALGTYKKKMWSATTPLNAAGGYINYYWHFKDLYFNDLSENFVSFIIA